MTVKDLTKQLRLTASLMELHEANPFKIRAYTSTVMAVERLGTQVFTLAEKDLIRAGITKGMAPRIVELRETGSIPELDELLEKTPAGVQDMLNLKGIGAKKVRSLWQDLGVGSMGALKEACVNEKVAELKGFGKKTQQQILDQLEYLEATAHLLHYSDAEEHGLNLKKYLEEEHPEAKITFAGELLRQLEVVAKLELLVATDSFQPIRQTLEKLDEVKPLPKQSGPFTWVGKVNGELDLKVHFCAPNRRGSEAILLGSAPQHLAHQINETSIRQKALKEDFQSEGELYQDLGIQPIPAFLREGSFEFEQAKENKLPKVVQEEDLKGVLHNHSTYSDGKNTLEEMALHARDLGYGYLGITDHSQAAFYANGLNVERVKDQHKEIDELNEKLAPFKIFKGIESDILSDGSLDYEEEVLRSFDFIVSSIHSNLKMDEAKATKRLITAIENPYTSILGHPTGRLLLKREGYPIDHTAVIDACAKHGVAIEINANPWRLDLDWRWVRYALDQGVKIAINPDAHEKDGYLHMRYGVLVGQKAGLTPDMTLNAMDADSLEAFFKKQKADRGIQ